LIPSNIAAKLYLLYNCIAPLPKDVIVRAYKSHHFCIVLKRSMKERLLISFLLALLLCPIMVQAQDLEHVNLKKPVTFSGNVNLQLETYAANGIENRRKPFSWLIMGNPTITILGVQLPFSFLLSNFENRYYQPFNQFGVSPRYKWITVHLGYRNIEFNPFTLGGYRMLGAGIELKPKGLRFGFMYGRLSRSTAIDTLQNANALAYRTQLSYTRMAYAVKLGAGSDKSYFDISYLKGWDKESSLAKEYRDSFPAQENVAIGFAGQLTLFKHLIWKTDIGASVYTNDIHSPNALDSNAEVPGIVKSIVTLRTSTQFLLAGETRLGWHGDKFGLDLVARRVDPDYKSMGAYFFQTDLMQYSVVPYLRLIKGKLLLNGSAGIQEDNLYKLKSATSKRFIGNANINFNPIQEFGFNANYSNYGITQNPTRTSPTAELFKQVSQNFCFVPYVNFSGEKGSESIQLVLSYQLLHSPVTSINTSPDQNTLVGSATYAHTWLSSGLSGNVSLNYNNTTITSQGKIGSYGIGIGSSVPVFKKKSNIGINATYSSNFYNSKSNGYTFNGDLSCTVPVYKKHVIQLAATYLNNQSKDETFVKTFSEYMFRIGYGYNF